MLDVFVFEDKAAEPLRQALTAGQLRWLATQDMRHEFERVLAYSQIAARMALHRLNRGDVLASFDRHATLVDAPPRASVTCRDDEDQKFIDLAVAHVALLLSKDRHVLSMKKKLSALAVSIQPAIRIM